MGTSVLATARGPGYARNEAVCNSRGDYLCHLDADDYMHSRRVELQLELAIEKGVNCLIGCNFCRAPANSTPYYQDWLNSLSDEELVIQQYRECTIICPSWFMHRYVFYKIAKLRSLCGNRAFVESYEDKTLQRIPEDTFFFMDHLQLGGTLSKVPKCLLTYRYTNGSWALGTRKQDLQKVRLVFLEKNILSFWDSFMIYGFGKDAKKIYNMLSIDMKYKVSAFCDVDQKKIGRLHFCRVTQRHRKVLDYKQVRPPFIVCVASKRYIGSSVHDSVEDNIASLGFTASIDYFQFC